MRFEQSVVTVARTTATRVRTIVVDQVAFATRLPHWLRERLVLLNGCAPHRSGYPDAMPRPDDGSGAMSPMIAGMKRTIAGGRSVTRRSVRLAPACCPAAIASA